MDQFRYIRVAQSVERVHYLRARSMISRGIAEYTDGPAPRRGRGRPKGSKNKPKPAPVSAEQVFADPTSPITPIEVVTTLPDSTRQGDAVDTAGNKPLAVE